MSNYLLVTIIFVCCYYLSGVHGQITCYSCNSYSDGAYGKACLDPMSSNVRTVTCASGYVCTKVSYVTQKILVTSRSCDPGTDTCNSIKRTLRNLYPDLASFHCNTCRKNFCNSNNGVIVEVSLSVLIISALLSKFF